MARRYALREDQWERIEGLLPGREDIPATDSLVMGKVMQIVLNKTLIKQALKDHAAKDKTQFQDDDPATKFKQLQNKQKRLEKELEKTIQNIADVESAKILGKQDHRIAKKILENLNSAFNETEVQIEQCKLQIQELQNRSNIDNILEITRSVKYNPQIVSAGPIKIESLQPHLKAFVDKIDVFYNKDKNEHKLIIRFKLPLINGKNDLTLDLKKNRKAA